MKKCLTTLFSIVLFYSSYSFSLPFSTVTLSPGVAYRSGDNIIWKRYLRFSDEGLLPTTDSRFKNNILSCFDKVYQASSDAVESYYLEHSRVKYLGEVFGESSRDTFLKSIDISFPKDIEPDLLYNRIDELVASDVIVNKKEAVRLCIRQTTGGMLTGITIPFSKVSGSQMKYVPDTKEYLPADLPIDGTFMEFVYKRDGELLPIGDTLPQDAAKKCEKEAFKKIAFDSDFPSDIQYLQDRYNKYFLQYVGKVMRDERSYNFKVEEYESLYTDSFLKESPVFYSLARKTIDNHKSCMVGQFKLEPNPKVVFVNYDQRVIVKYSRNEHGFSELAKIPVQ